MRWLLDAGVDVNIRNAGDSTALHSAAGSGQQEVVAELLRRKADPAALDSGDQRAAELAHARGHDDVARLIEAK